MDTQCSAATPIPRTRSRASRQLHACGQRTLYSVVTPFPSALTASTYLLTSVPELGPMLMLFLLLLHRLWELPPSPPTLSRLPKSRRGQMHVRVTCRVVKWTLRRHSAQLSRHWGSRLKLAAMQQLLLLLHLRQLRTKLSPFVTTMTNIVTKATSVQLQCPSLVPRSSCKKRYSATCASYRT